MVSEISQIQKDKQVINSHISTKRTNSIIVSFKSPADIYNGGNFPEFREWSERLTRKTTGKPDGNTTGNPDGNCEIFLIDTRSS